MVFADGQEPLTPEVYRNVLRYAHGDADLVHRAYLAWREGERVWTPARCDFATFLRGAVRSLMSSDAKAGERSRIFLDEGIHKRGGVRSPEDLLSGAESEAIAAHAIACGVDDDAGLLAWSDAVLDLGGAGRRAEIASALGWEPAAASAARVKLQRRMSANMRRDGTSDWF